MKHFQSAFLAFLAVLTLVFSPLLATDAALAADTTFDSCYEIAANFPPGFANPILRVDLAIDTNRTVNGEGEITPNLLIEGIPPLKTYLEGNYISPLFRGAPYYLISANGYNLPPCPNCGPIGPVRIENVKNLEINTLSKTAGYDYRSLGSREFTHVGPVPVNKVDCPAFGK